MVIDWKKPIYCEGKIMVHDATHDQSGKFKCLIFPDDPYQKRWYYHRDGVPFGRNPHHISNYERVTLQFEQADGSFCTFEALSVKAGINAAVTLAHQGCKPLRILSPNGGVLLAKKALQQQIEFARSGNRPQHSETLQEQLERAREAIENARLERRMQRMEELPDWGAFA